MVWDWMAKSLPVSPRLAHCITHPSFFFFNSWVCLFISLAASGLSCSTLDLSLWCIGSSVVACRLSCRKASGIFPDQGSNPCPLHWKVDGFLTTRPPGMSLYSILGGVYFTVFHEGTYAVSVSVLWCWKPSLIFPPGGLLWPPSFHSPSLIFIFLQSALSYLKLNLFGCLTGIKTPGLCEPVCAQYPFVQWINGCTLILYVLKVDGAPSPRFFLYLFFSCSLFHSFSF